MVVLNSDHLVHWCHGTPRVTLTLAKAAKIREGLHYNPYFPRGAIAMPKMLNDGAVEYEDGTPATETQMGKDIVSFLSWAAEPEMEERKLMGFKWIFVLSLALLQAAYYRRLRRYSKLHTYYGIFVEVEGVPALIHQTEVSWDDTLDIISHFKIGQVVEAKVHQLDFSLERIFLSLKEVMPDPLIETLEVVVGDQANLDGRLEAAEPDEQWPEVESLVKELQQYKGVDQVKKGGFFLSSGLAPTFQVYMASVVDNEYKLLARAGNKVQEVIVETSMGKEEMKSAILTCANRVE